MAKEKNGSDKAAETAEAPATPPTSNGSSKFASLKRGARRATAVADAPWLAREAGVQLYGKLIGCFVMQGDTRGDKRYLQVETMVEVAAVKGKGKDAKTERYPEGTVVNVGFQKKVEELANYVVPRTFAGGVYEIGLEIGEKVPTKSGNDFWPMDTFYKELKAPTAPVAKMPSEVEMLAQMLTGSTGDNSSVGDEAAF